MIPFGKHEMEYSLSIVPIISLCLIILLNKKYFKINLKNFNFFLILAVIFFIPLYFNLNFLNQYNFTSQIPIIKSTWVQFRWMAIYIVPIIFLTGLLVENIKINQKYKNYISVCFIIILLVQNSIKDNNNYLQSASYNIEDTFNFNKKFEEGLITATNKGSLGFVEQGWNYKKN